MSDWAKSKVTELKAELKRRGLAQAGLKAELIARLEADDEAAGASQGTEDPDIVADQENEAHDAPSEDEADVEAATSEKQLSEPVEAQGDASASAVASEPTETEANLVVTEDANGHDPDPPVEQDPTGAQESMDTDEKPETVPQTQSKKEDSPAPSNPSAVIQQQSQASYEGFSSEVAADALKRKRRSASPTPKEDSVKRRRAQEASEGINEAPVQAAQTPTETGAGAAIREGDHISKQAREHADTTNDTLDDAELAQSEQRPATHPNTSAIYVSNLMRPLREPELRTHLVELATSPNREPENDPIIRFFVDSIRTHAFVVFKSTNTAIRVRNRLHGCVWPEESNRKALFVDFIPADKVDSWIEAEEESVRDRKTGLRWEVVYQQGDDGIEASLQSISSTPAAPARPAGRGQSNNIGIEGAPTGPRSQRAPAVPSRYPRAPPHDQADPWDSRQGPPPPRTHRSSVAEGAGEPTMAQPVIFFQSVPVAMARRRLQDMRSFYTRDTMRPLGREINRYSFQDDDKFIDRGREVFEGIRPPHRQQAIDRELRVGNGGGSRGGSRGGGRGGWPPRRGPAPFRSRGDRYIPVSGGFPDERGFGQGRDADDRRW